MDYMQEISLKMTNYWNQLILNLPNYLAAIIVFVLGFILSRQVYKLSYQLINRYSKDLLVANFLAKSIRIIFLLLILILSLNLAGWGDVAKNLFAAAGLSAVVLGFAFKDIGENFISGVMLSFDRPFDLDDTIMVGDIFGKVKLMELRYTKLKTFDGRDVYIPNSDIIKKAVYNYTEDHYYRIDFVISVDNKYDLETLESKVLKTVLATRGVVHNDTHETFVALESITDTVVNMKAYIWMDTTEYRTHAHEIKSEVIANVKSMMEKDGKNPIIA